MIYTNPLVDELESKKRKTPAREWAELLFLFSLLLIALLLI